jgi:hypothetical protein
MALRPSLTLRVTMTHREPGWTELVVAEKMKTLVIPRW